MVVPSSCGFLAVSLTFSLILVSWFTASYFHNRLPTVRSHSSSSDRFVAAHAKKNVDKLTNFGPRPVGSFSNEVQAVDFLVSQLTEMKGRANSSLVGLEVDVQKMEPASFHLDIFSAGLTQHYSGIQNVVARLSPKSDKFIRRPAILINCHFDSVPMSPGASDDGISCALMLGVARVILNSKRVVLTNDLVLLFNGAEEVLLPASHGFITQHPWAEDCKAFVNLEAAGAGGRELLFQTGPGHGWLLDSYIKTVPYPFANVLGQEIFQSGLVPSDTDFRVFRDFGGLSGLDLAFVRSGWVYHTEYDTSARLDLASVQRAGDNLLALTLRLLRRRNLANITSSTSSSSTPVFFDFLGLYVVRYPAWAGICLNLLLVCISLGAAHHDLTMLSKKLEVDRTLLTKVLLVFLTSELLALVLALVVSAVSSLSLAMLGCSMTWFSRPSLLPLLHSLPAFLVILKMSTWTRTFLSTRSWLPPSDDLLQIPSFHSTTLSLSLLTLIPTLAGLRSAALFSLPLLPCLVWWTLAHTRRPSWPLFLLYLTLQGPTLTMWSYVVQLLFIIFIPLMGRRGAEGNPDLILGVGTVLCTFLLLITVRPIISSIRRQFLLKTGCWVVFLSTLLYVTLLGGGFPYSGDPANPSPQRLSIYHTSRTFTDQMGHNTTDSGLLVSRWDHHWCPSLEKQVPLYMSARRVDKEDCLRLMGCGLPLHRSTLMSPQSSLWIPTSPPKLTHSRPTFLTLVNQTSVPGGSTHLTLEVDGPSRLVVLLSLAPPAHLVGWSLTEGTPPSGQVWGSQTVRMVQFVRGLTPVPQQFSLSVRGWSQGQQLLSAAVTGHHHSGQDMAGPVLKHFLDQHPPWVSPAAWTVDYKYFVF